MKIEKTICTFTAEKLKSPFGFKGGYLSELWQVVCKISAEGVTGVGVGVQSVLWSDEKVFLCNDEKTGNTFMFKTTEYAAKLLEGRRMTTPVDLTDSIFDEVYEYAKSLTSEPLLRATFVRNALVAVDNALWQLYAKINGKQNLLELLGEEYLPALSFPQEKLSNIPLLSYGVNSAQIKNLLDNGSIILKIKIGNDNSGKMSKEQMLEWDKSRLLEIHEIAKNYSTNYTISGKILYYLDANGKYDTLDRLNGLTDYAKEIGALDSILLLEEPFPEEMKIDVSSVPVRIAADESVHSEKDVKERIELGYGAITLKPIAKTLSETLKILKIAFDKGVPCFAADLTVNPLLVEWNKNVAARIKPLPDLKIGVLESNGEQNYSRWEKLKEYHPKANASFTECKNGIYTLDQEFYNTSGGIFCPSKYYDNLI